MISAYREIYLNKAQSVLGEAFDYAVNSCSIKGEDFVKLFVASSVSKKMENGEPKFIAGKSGIEIVRDIVFETMNKELDIEPQIQYSRSKEYWIGWAVAFCQWYSSRKYSDIFKAASYEELEKMYYTLHEADISKFADIVTKRMKEFFPDTNLKRIRTAYGCTQAELAAFSGVSLRSIQMYEQRNKDINKASVDTVFRLAKALGCTVEELIEPKEVIL
ncbi:MAG: helix-turn-helix domain-containing protein [Clostridia bacterium]|nr:helix-turn-helix domain-containing protein [Clostridia bacterium]